jgi:hypothetical protein
MNLVEDRPSFRERLARFLGCSVDDLIGNAPQAGTVPSAPAHGCIRDKAELRAILLRIKAINDSRKSRLAGSNHH